MDDNLIERRRKPFERRILNESLDPVSIARNPDGSYVLLVIQMRWVEWNAALDSAVVELPDVYDFHSTSGMRRGCAEAIERAGLRVKS